MRNFLDYYKDYCSDTLPSLSMSFIEWTKFKGYVETIFGNTMYVQFEQCYYESTYNQSAYFLYKEEAKQREILIDKKFTRFVEQDFERDELEDQDEYSEGVYIERFIEAVFSKSVKEGKYYEKEDGEGSLLNLNKGEYRKTDREGVIAFLKQNIVRGENVYILRGLELVDDYLRDVGMLLSEYETYSQFKDITYYIVNRVGNCYWQDFGFLVYLTPHIIVFYQLTDDN